MLEARRPLHEFADLLAGTAIARIELAAGRVVFVTRDPELRLIVPPDDPRLVATDLLNFDTFEAAELALLRRVTPPGGVVFDIGANVGWHAMVLARTVPGVSVHAFEPVPATYRALEAHLVLNEVVAVRPHNFGFSREAGRPSFYLPAEAVNASAANLSGRPDARRVEVEIRTVDAFVREERVVPALLKIDVEGAELPVLQGAADTLLRHRPKVFAEMLRKWTAPFGYHPNDLLALMTAAGYGCYAIRGDRLAPFAAMDDTTADTNFLFLHREAHAADVAALTRPG